MTLANTAGKEVCPTHTKGGLLDVILVDSGTPIAAVEVGSFSVARSDHAMVTVALVIAGAGRRKPGLRW